MAAAASSAPLDPLLGRAVDFVRPDFHQVNLDIENYLKSERGFKLDSGKSTPSRRTTWSLANRIDDQICRLSLLPPGCPLPASQCPFRHTQPSPANFKPPPPLPTHPREREKKTTVCKHYLRNLCKIGDNCEYTHDFNLRTMPICIFFVKTGKCELGGECLYFHPRDRRVECPDYNRGFCRLGEPTRYLIYSFASSLRKDLNVRGNIFEGYHAVHISLGFAQMDQAVNLRSKLISARIVHS